MATWTIILCHDVEEERFNIKVECFMIKEELCQKTKVLTVNLQDRQKVFQQQWKENYLATDTTLLIL